ncbi:hypothetical protein COL154_002639 [Colletotrichum chrysophilum]|uniref:uncharacterized protein n=1 Tax=Colletotrichum chrysophilum TaxID=1836956 RepID=UPI0023000C32|nr:uncharacterized protein COL26b_002087 [Colletotrichum chrysophilum]KAJ0346170.1 hypothetical protein KNSL1_007744 [Colletotrichum chrysophilum]KAJ0368358.1 hypothetical protein COL154_002639 [Colletotrichum chrysophilum]KAJ0379579.1 hypothetical protein COL26b_002087 [Colletotrichum chrysophilum]
MTNPSEDSGCLSVLSSCFKRRGKPRPGPSECPNQLAPLVSSATQVTELSSLNPANDETSASTNPEIQTPAFLEESSSAPSAVNVKDKPASVTPITDQESATTDRAAATVDLWQEAYNKVDENTRKWIDSIPGAANAKDPVKELVELVRLREEKHGKWAPKLTIGGRQIWRDYASRVISLLTAIGDIAVTVAPAPSSTVWSAVKMLLKLRLARLKQALNIEA